VVGLGGGSVVDLGKSVACLAANPGSALDYVEVIGSGRAFTQRSLPFVAVPTTSGTGAEVTRNAVLGSKQHAVKVSLRSEWMLPALAVIDPELALTLPRDITAATGLDALTQVLEPYLSCFANPLTDALCVEALTRVGTALVAVCRDGSDLHARTEMSLVSLFGGLALANAKLGAVHGLAGPLGGMLDAPHGALCARLLAPVLQVNFKAVQSRGGEAAGFRFTRAAQLILGRPDATPSDLARWFDEVCAEVSIPRLASYGFERRQIDDTVSKAQRASSMKGNPVALTDAEVAAILEAAL
jgi:alcohol dehydrogenase class IV